MACGGEKQPPPLPPACEVPVNGTAVTFRLVPGTRFANLLVTSPPNDLRRFTIDQGGRIKQFDDAGYTTTLLDISNGDIAAGGEQGLLGLAFHPKFATNGQFFIYYTTSNANVVARYEISATDPNVADPATATTILSIPDFASNHNGGMIEFGPDGFLYIGTGDGGGGGDPMGNGQNPNALLAKLLRIDVDKQENGKPYGIPAGNPFAAGGGAPEVFVMGLRNPWRWSFDRMTGDIYIGDVGQDEIEELTMLPAGKAAGANLGWRMYEGQRCYDGPCDPVNKVMPQFEKTHAENWCSVIGGEVYRGGCYPDLVGTYFFSDYCSHELYAGKKTGTALTFEMPAVSYIDGNGTHAGFPDAPTSLHADARGELYLTADAGIFRMEVVP
jgi:glucose/arabinose dehydrogenase